MLKLKKGLSFLTALAISASCFPMMAMAEGETTTVEPEIFFYRDYEDYKGGNHQHYTDGIADYSGNNSKFYGTWNWSIDDVAKGSLAVDGYDGKAVQYKFTNSYHITNGGTFKDISDGKLYYAFDMWGDPAEQNRVMFVRFDGTVSSGDKNGIYALCWYPGVVWNKTNMNYVGGETSKEFMNGVSEKTRVELVVDPEAGTVDKYFNGNFAQQVTFTPQTITTATMYISEGHTMDNFAVVHYPEGYTGTYSLKGAKINPVDNTIKVTVNADAYDSNGAQVKGDATFNYPIAAPYGVSLTEVDATSFTVANGDAPLTVTGVTKGEKNGEYVIAVSEKLAGGTYTVAAKDGLADIAGLAVNEDAKAVTFTATAEPNVLFYRDYEDFTASGAAGSATRDPFNQAKIYGTSNFAGDSSWDKATVVDGIDGKAAMLGANHITDGGSTGGLTKGKVYFAIDEYVTNTTNREDTLVINKDTENGVAFGWFPGVKFNTRARNWGSDYSKTEQMNGTGYYRIEGIIDVATGTVDRYINGVYVGRITVRSDSLKGNITSFRYAGSNGNYIDNVVLIHFPEDIIQPTFSVVGNDIDTANKKISVQLKADVVDSNAANNGPLTADYGITLTDLQQDDFSVEGLTVDSIERGQKSGEYVITVAEELSNNVNYKVTAKADLVGINGEVLKNATANVIKPTEAEVLYYRDFEDFEKGQKLGNNQRSYGSMYLNFDGTWVDNTDSVLGRTGKGIDANVNHVSDNFIMTKETDGQIYFTFTTESIDGLTPSGFTKIGTNTSTKDCTYFEWKHGEDFGVGSWSTAMNGTLPEELVGLDYYKIEVLADITTKNIKAYINGIKVADMAFSGQLPNENTNIKIQDNVIFDNFAIIYFPEKLVSMPTFSVEAGAIDAENNKVSVFLKSDSYDSDGALGGTAGVSAPYGITLSEFDASSFAVDGYTVTAVSKGDAVGEYVITLAEDITDDASLTVTAADGLADILGSVVNADSKSVTVGASEYSLSDVTIDGAKASISYTNTTKKPESFVLVIASYVGDQMSDVNFENVTAAIGSQNVEASVSLQTSVEGKTVKAFVLKDFTSLTPIK